MLYFDFYYFLIIVFVYYFFCYYFIYNYVFRMNTLLAKRISTVFA